MIYTQQYFLTFHPSQLSFNQTQTKQISSISMTQQQPPSPIQNIQWEQDSHHEHSYAASFKKMFMGTRVLFDLHMMDFLSINKKEYLGIQPDIQSCQSKFRNSLLSCLALSAALALSLRRYIPSLYANLTLTQFVLDMGIATAGLVLGSRYASNVVQLKVNSMISGLIVQKDHKFLQFLQQFQTKYKISNKHISKLVAASQTQKLTLYQILHQHEQKSTLNKTNLIH